MQTGSSFSELYSAYAAGCLDPGFALMVEAQSLLRPDIRRAISQSEMIAGVFLESARPAGMADGALERALAAVDAVEADASSQRSAGRRACGRLDELLALPEPIREAALEAAGTRPWKKLTRGLQRLPLSIGSQVDVELFRIEPCARIPRHAHDGSEFTLVLSGGFSDERGHYGPGDVSVSGPGEVHQPVADADGVCYALSVRDGQLHFTGALGVVQRMLTGR